MCCLELQLSFVWLIVGVEQMIDKDANLATESHSAEPESKQAVPCQRTALDKVAEQGRIDTEREARCDVGDVARNEWLGAPVGKNDIGNHHVLAEERRKSHGVHKPGQIAKGLGKDGVALQAVDDDGE